MVEQRRQRNVQKDVMHVQIAFWPFSLPSLSLWLKLPNKWEVNCLQTRTYNNQRLQSVGDNDQRCYNSSVFSLIVWQMIVQRWLHAAINGPFKPPYLFANSVTRWRRKFDIREINGGHVIINNGLRSQAIGSIRRDRLLQYLHSCPAFVTKSLPMKVIQIFNS